MSRVQKSTSMAGSTSDETDYIPDNAGALSEGTNGVMGSPRNSTLRIERNKTGKA